MFQKYVATNTRDLKLALIEGRRPMNEFFDPRYDDIPFFSNEMTGEGWGNGHHSSFSMAHIPGRWLNALLNAEDVLAIPTPPETVAKLQKWAYNAMELTGIRVPGCIDPATMQIVKSSDLHNLREQMHALYALVKFRGDEKSRILALELIDAAGRYFMDETGEFDEAKFQIETGGTICRWSGMNAQYPFPLTFGRYIGPLVKFFKATGEPKALQQAICLKNYCLDHVINENGDYSSWRFGSHTHSTTAMLSSLAQLYEVTREEKLLQRILAFMDNGLKQIALDFGWCIENFNRRDNVGEINNTSDIMETCLILGKCGVAGAYARAERILRAHFLPAQLLDTHFIPEDDDPTHVTTYHMTSRAKGAFGFPCPFGHEDHPDASISFNWDITGGGVGGLCEAVREALTLTNALVSINLLFDGETDFASFQSQYGRDGTVVLTVKKTGVSARVRIPTGTDACRVNSASAVQDGEWLYMYDFKGTCIIHFDFAVRKVAYPFRDTCYYMTWNGEEVLSCASAGKRLCFFPEE